MTTPAGKNAYLVEGDAQSLAPAASSEAGRRQEWPTMPDYVSPWSYASLAERVSVIPLEDCCRGLVDLLLQITREADRELAKALLDAWAIEGILRDN